MNIVQSNRHPLTPLPPTFLSLGSRSSDSSPASDSSLSWSSSSRGAPRPSQKPLSSGAAALGAREGEEAAGLNEERRPPPTTNTLETALSTTPALPTLSITKGRGIKKAAEAILLNQRNDGVPYPDRTGKRDRRGRNDGKEGSTNQDERHHRWKVRLPLISIVVCLTYV